MEQWSTRTGSGLLQHPPYITPRGRFESNEGGFRSWGGCLDLLIITHSHTWYLRDLRGLDRE
eukprot:3187243-Prymnesium_polylepis.1